MLPVFLDLKYLKLYTMGIFLVLGFFWAIYILWRNTRLTSHKEDDIFDSLFFSLAVGLFFGRLVFVLLNFEKFGFSIFKFILINGYPGFSIWGGLISTLISLYFYFSIKKINFFETIDYFMTPLFTALAFGKLGGFFSGSEIGEKTNFILRTKYSGFEGLRHLTPLYEGLLFIAAAIIGQKILMEIRKEKFFKGFLLYIGIWYFSFIYLLFDKLKVNHLYLLGYSFNKMVAAILLLTISIYFIYYFRSGILSFIKSYGQKIIKKIHFGSKRKA